MKKIIESPNSPEAIGPYSQGVRAGDFLYVSGQIALDRESGELKLKTIAEEVECVLKNSAPF
jgi:2-iminobutanoate/2-iminopropanoate deaminase